jgi:hypothetical protein
MKYAFLLSIVSKGKEIVVHGSQALDSCLQKIIPGLDHPTILLAAPNDMDQERHRAIGVILEKFHCPVMNFLKQEPAKPATQKNHHSIALTVLPIAESKNSVYLIVEVESTNTIVLSILVLWFFVMK